MANRVTATQVKDVMGITLEDAVVTSYISAANAMIDGNLLDSNLGDTLLEQIELFLSAHFIAATRERMASKEGAEGAEITYIGKFADKLNSTPYGQIAIGLDSTGILASLGGKAFSLSAVKQFDT